MRPSIKQKLLLCKIILFEHEDQKWRRKDSRVVHQTSQIIVDRINEK